MAMLDGMEITAEDVHNLNEFLERMKKYGCGLLPDPDIQRNKYDNRRKGYNQHRGFCQSDSTYRKARAEMKRLQRIYGVKL